jgi:hypothetical protein
MFTFSWEVNGWLWAALLFGYFVFDTSYAKYTIYTQQLKSVSAANTSVFMLLMGVAGTLVAYNNLINLVPMAVGCWLGTFLAIEWEIKLKKKNGKRIRKYKVCETPKG